MSIQSRPLAGAGAEVLLWQNRIRIIVAILVAGIEVALQQAGVLRGSPPQLVACIAAYVVVIALLTLRIRALDAARDWIVLLTVAADLLIIFGTTYIAAPAGSYHQVLILSFFIVHLTESYFGRRVALATMAAVVAGYIGLVYLGIAEGAHLVWPAEIVSAIAFVLAATAFIMQYDSVRRRLTRIVVLFEGAEEGDLSETYDVAADLHPDVVTQVGRAYNRVRGQLENMVTTDPLTDCLNRRGFDQNLAREVARSTRAGSEVALLALDLDHFKEVNDSFGHLAGDEVLREAGALLRQTVRTGDTVARTGGEEFSILLPDTGGIGAFQLATRICDIFRDHRFQVRGKEVHITVSLGVIATVPVRGHDGTALLTARADDALYAAKRSGRDRVRSWSPEMSLRASGEMGLRPLAQTARRA